MGKRADQSQNTSFQSHILEKWEGFSVAKMAIFMNFAKFDDPSISYRLKNHL